MLERWHNLNGHTIESHPSAPEGEVKWLGTYSPPDFPPSACILCRNTAPLVGFAYSLLKRDVPCRILGRDIGANLISLVKKLRAINLQDLDLKLQVWLDRETEKANAEDRNPERLYDQAECIRFFVDSLDEDSRTVDSLVAKIELMFTDKPEATRLTLSTVHKAKGLEFETVFILDFEKYMPSRWAQQSWAKVQEQNIIYVAVTRAKRTLVYISTECWKEG
jgi:DNA helicase II / ATP-dependent DNA helicase PcrA